MIWRAVVCIFAMTPLTSCGDRSFSLSDKVELVRLNGHDWALVSDDGKFILEPRVVSITCGEEWAYGEHDGSGNFLINLQSGQVNTSLKQARLKAELDAVGVEYAEPHEVRSLERAFSGCA